MSTIALAVTNANAAARKGFLTLYRVFALVLLYGILVAILAYVGTMVYFLTSTSFICPVLISPSNTQILSLTETIVSSKGAIDSFVMDRDRQQATVNELSQQKLALEKLDHELEQAISEARSSDLVSGEALTSLGQQKNQDIAKTEPLVQDAGRVEREINADLQAGLISKSDAAVQRATLNQFSNDLTDNKINAVLIQDTTRQKLQTDLTTVDALAQRAQIDAQIATFAVQITTGLEEIRSDSAQIDRLNAAIKVAQGTAYFRASASPNQLAFAFVPFSNEKNVTVGTPIYDCYVGILACYRVGYVERIFPDEERQTNPILHSDMRGYLVQLSLTRSKAAKSMVLYVGHKPLGL